MEVTHSLSSLTLLSSLSLPLSLCLFFLFLPCAICFKIGFSWMFSCLHYVHLHHLQTDKAPRLSLSLSLLPSSFIHKPTTTHVTQVHYTLSITLFSSLSLYVSTHTLPLSLYISISNIYLQVGDHISRHQFSTQICRHLPIEQQPPLGAPLACMLAQQLLMLILVVLVFFGLLVVL